MITYPLTCPKCGATLQPVALDAFTAPWLCPIDSLGFWAAELTVEARALFNIETNSRDSSPESETVGEACYVERDDAQLRGTSLRLDQITFTSIIELKYLVSQKHIDHTFIAAVVLYLKNSGH